MDTGASTGPEETPTVDDDYMFNRGHADSARLALQHWLWLYRLRYVLQPSIPTRSDLRIADVGTGNAIWIFEVLPHLHYTSLIDGFDISADHFPAREWLPSNVSLRMLDIFEGLPPHLTELYDIVHIRTFAVIVRNCDPEALLRNLIKMLKPGGYLQWDEMDLTTFWPGTVNPSASKVAAVELMTRWRAECRNAGIIYEYDLFHSMSFLLSNRDES